MFSLVVACDENRGFGKKGKMPWPKNSQDLRHFHEITTSGEKNYLIMGRKTWKSLPESVKTDPNRDKIVVSNSLPLGNIHGYNAEVVSRTGHIKKNDAHYWIIGGSEYLDFLFSDDATFISKIYLTEIKGIYNSDKFLPKIPPYFQLVQEKSFNGGKFLTYQNRVDRESQEKRYLRLLQDIWEKGELRPDRTGIGTISLFGNQLNFDLQSGFPLLTTKKVFFRGLVEELLFFLRGDHDNRKLQEKGIKIWDGNTSRAYLNGVCPQLETHDLGLAYGVQWRAAGAELGDIATDYRGKGVDQVAEVLRLLREDPNSRRIIINSWNVPQLKDMCLPPCHIMYQFYVSQEKYLDCMMTQRSADMFLGVPFNIASTALLTHIFADTVKLIPGRIIINLGDTHIYKNHIKQVEEQLQRPCISFPKIYIDKKLNTVEDIEKLEYSDIILKNYLSWPTIKAEMAV